jgi:D-aspartate ligase
MNTTVPVVVIHRGGYGTIAIARTLGRLGVPVYLVAQTGMSSPAWSSRYWAGRMRWDFSAPEEESVSFLRDVGARLGATHGSPAILLTVADWVAIFLERNGDALQGQFVFPQPVQPILQTLLNKWGMHLLANEHGIPTATTICPASLADVDRFVEATGFPIVMKAADPFVPERPPTKLISSKQELMDDLGDRVSARIPLNVVLQDYIPGDVATVWMCNGYFGSHSRDPIIFTGKKLRQMSRAGIASLAVCLPNEIVATQTRRFMEGVGYRGCVGIGYRYDHRDGSYKVLDVNARVSGVFRLFAGTNDMDVVRACYLDVTGQTVPLTALQPGRKWMLENDFGPAIEAIKDGSLTIAEWVRSVRGVREWHWLAADDPRPGFVWLRDVLRSAVRRAVGARMDTP